MYTVGQPYWLTIACLVTWPLNGSKVGGNLVLIQISLLLLCKFIKLL